MLFDAWSDLGRVLAVGTLTYAALVLILRVSGKRTLAKLNAFDFVVTIALGSTLASALLASEVTVAEAVAALALLAVLQLAVAWLAVRLPVARRTFRSAPTLLLRDGEFLAATLLRERVTEGEIRQAVRSRGLGSLEEVAAVVLETDGTLSVIRRADIGSGGALADLGA